MLHKLRMLHYVSKNRQNKMQIIISSRIEAAEHYYMNVPGEQTMTAPARRELSNRSFEQTLRKPEARIHLLSLIVHQPNQFPHGVASQSLGQPPPKTRRPTLKSQLPSLSVAGASRQKSSFSFNRCQWQRGRHEGRLATQCGAHHAVRQRRCIQRTRRRLAVSTCQKNCKGVQSCHDKSTGQTQHEDSATHHCGDGPQHRTRTHGQE